ncbi:MAG: Fic family protein [Acidobacteriota bacterium]
MSNDQRERPIAKTREEYEAILQNAHRYYCAFPPFQDWPPLSSRQVDVWNDAVASAEAAKENAPQAAHLLVAEALFRIASAHSDAIEALSDNDRGLTLSAVLEEVALQAIASEKGEPVGDPIDAQRNAFELTLDMATRATGISEVLVRRLHKEVCGPQRGYVVHTAAGPREQEFPKGRYKTSPNYPWKQNGEVVVYAPPDKTAQEMERLISELRSTDFCSAHPIAQAAYAHYATVAVHPFADGNGRIARLLASIFLLRATPTPFLIWSDQKSLYLDSLAAADSGDVSAFQRFVFDCTVNALHEFSFRLRAASRGESMQTATGRVNSLLTGVAGLSHADTQAIGERVFEFAIAALEATRAKAKFIAGVSWESNDLTGVSRHLDGYRTLNPRTNDAWELRIRCTQPVSVCQTTTLLAYVRSGVGSPFDFVVSPARADTLELRARITEVYPAITEAFESRTRIWAEHTISRIVSDFGSELEAEMKRAGY